MANGGCELCMTVMNASTERGASVIAAPCGAGDHQVFETLDTQVGGVTFQEIHSARCFGTRGKTAN